MPATKQNDGLWRFQKVIVDPITGEKIRLRKRGYKSKRDAEIAEASAIIEATSQPELLDEVLGKVVIDDFVSYKDATINARSMQKKNRMINAFILPNLGNLDLNKFTNLHARKYYDKLIHFEASLNHKNAILDLTKSIFYHAETHFGISAQPIRRLQKFKIIKSKRRLFDVYDIEDFEKFNSTFSEDTEYELTLKTFFNVLFWTGARRGEAKGLKWNDIFFKSNEIRIDEQFIDKDPIQGRTVCDVKTSNSIREILTDNVTMNMLKKLKELRMQNEAYSEDDYVFLRMDENIPLADTTIDRLNRLHAQMAKLKRIRIHDFRHSFASVNFSLGADVATISRQLGHSSISITLDIYVTMISKKNDERVGMLNDARNSVLEDIKEK